MTMDACDKTGLTRSMFVMFVIFVLSGIVSQISSFALTSESSDVYAIVKAGDTIRLNCSAASSHSCPEWGHLLQDANPLNGLDFEVCDCEDVRTEYKSRFHCDYSSTGAFSLTISNVTVNDTGTYICKDSDGHKLHSTKLFVADDVPKCSSNVNLNEVIGPNVGLCDHILPPDEVHLSCSATFGDTRHTTGPLIQWTLAGQGGVLESHCTNDSKTVNCTTVKKATSDLNAKLFICSTIDERHSCELGPITVLYAYNRSSATVKAAKIGDTVLCKADTNSQNCTYKWKKYTAHADGDEDKETASQNNSLEITQPGNYRCEARCQFRNNKCLLFPTAINVPANNIHAVGYSATNSTQTFSSSTAVNATWLLYLIAFVLYILSL